MIFLFCGGGGEERSLDKHKQKEEVNEKSIFREMVMLKEITRRKNEK